MKKLFSLLDVKFLKFVLVGIINTAVDYGLFLILRGICPDTPLWLHWIVVTAIPCAVASVLSYFLNKYFTFKSKTNTGKTMVRFVLNISLCYLLAYGGAKPLARWIFSGASVSLQENMAMLAGMCFFVAFNYIGQRFFVFKGTQEEK